MHLGAAPGEVLGLHVRVDVGQRPVRVVRRQVPVPHELQVPDGGGAADLLPADLPGEFLRLGVGVGEGEGRGGQDPQVLGAAAVAGQAGFDVPVEGLARFQGAVPAEDRVGFGGGELAALLGVAGLEK
ncbi:hypothetical protein GCM10020256_06370 [Streptomyces thermocoprophilus]